MSLINEALKKAQRARNDGAAPAATDADGRVAKRAEPKSAKSTLFIAVGAATLVVISMVGTALWMSRTPAAHTETKPAVAKPAEPAAAASSGPTLVVPPLSSPAPASPVATAPKPAAPKPETVPANNAAPVSAPVATVAAPTPPPVVAPPPAKSDERVHQFVEAIRVTGIRASGSDSKVLMNDRVYRVNDVVDRTLNVRLTKVSSDSLTFTDANGVTYVKYF